MDKLVQTMFLLFYMLLIDCAETHGNEFKGFPKNMTLRWEENKMVIESAWEQYEQPFDDFCFKMDLRLRANNTTQWQIYKISSDCSISDLSIKCYFSNPDLDEEKCYEMQAQFQVQDFCLKATPKSQWSDTVFMKNGSLYDLCPKVVTYSQQKSMEMQRLVIILFSTALSVMFLVIIFIGCFMKRVNKWVFPIIPDPKNAFYDLYDSQNGYLQEWMKTSRNSAQFEEKESVDEQDGDQMSTFLKDDEAVISDNEETVEIATATSAPLVENVSDICFGNMNFTMNDSMYIML